MGRNAWKTERELNPPKRRIGLYWLSDDEFAALPSSDGYIVEATGGTDRDGKREYALVRRESTRDERATASSRVNEMMNAALLERMLLSIDAKIAEGKPLFERV